MNQNLGRAAIFMLEARKFTEKVKNTHTHTQIFLSHSFKRNFTFQFASQFRQPWAQKTFLPAPGVLNGLGSED